MVRPPPTSPLFPSTPLPRPSTASPPPAASDNTGIRQRRAHVDGTPFHTWSAPGPAAHGCGELNTGVAYTYTQPCAGERGLNAAMTTTLPLGGVPDGVHTPRPGAVDTGRRGAPFRGVTPRPARR